VTAHRYVLASDDAAAWEPAIVAAVDALAAGLLVVVPTETVHGIAARPDLPGATERVFAAKRRDRELGLPVLAATGTEALGLAASGGPAAERLAAAFWPGPLTMVLPRGRRSHGWALGEHTHTIGVRVPAHPVALELLRRTGPLAVTSANRSGRPPLAAAGDLVATFGDDVAVYLVDPTADPGGAASTVVDLTGSGPSVVRHGPIDADHLRAVAEGTIPPSQRLPAR
jgi:tRNA threonylcarbamoyl adenosine modification protein (Sua5/YciO/YrdC/YwlC family)